jgi:predicted RNA-binding protein (TIGR00451 family)
LSQPTPPQLRKLIGVANYQFGKGVGRILFDKKVRIICSRRTGRIRHVLRGRQLIATLRPKDGYLALTMLGAKLILQGMKAPPNIVAVQNDVSEFIRAGGDVFAKHIVRADTRLRPAEEAIVVDENNQLLAIGHAVLSGNDMQFFKRGVAVKVRRAVADSKSLKNSIQKPEESDELELES